MNKDLPVIDIGGGGHAKVLMETLKLLSFSILGYVDPRKECADISINGIYWIGDDSRVLKYASDEVRLVNGVGSTLSPHLRKKVYSFFKSKGYFFASVIHPSAVIASDVYIGEGVQIMAGSIIQPSCSILENAVINTKASVDHDCFIHPHVHIAPGATLSGGVHIMELSHIGTGASVIQNVKIGQECVIGAGAVVIDNVQDGLKVIRVPAKPRM